MVVCWGDYLWKEPHPLPPSELEKLERKWGVVLPEAYKRLVAMCQGMAPEPCVFKVEEGSNVLSVLLTVTRDEGVEEYSIENACRVMAEYVPHGIYPFGMTPGGEYLCFDYRDSPEQPRIVLVSVDMSIYPVADSFQEFLEALHDPDAPPAPQ